MQAEDFLRLDINEIISHNLSMKITDPFTSLIHISGYILNNVSVHVSF